MHDHLDTREAAPARRGYGANRLPARQIGWGLLVLGAILLLVWAALLASAGLSLRGHLSTAQALLQDPGKVDLPAACVLMQDLRRDVVTLRDEAGGLAGLAPALAWLPRYGGDLRAAPQLLAIADGLSETGAIGCAAFAEAVPVDGGSAMPSLEQAAQILSDNKQSFQAGLAATRRAQAAASQLDLATLSPGLAQKLALLDRGLPLAETGLSFAVDAPDLLGFTRPHTYLVLALNEDELRPGGGFITGAGEVRIEAGRVVTMTFRDSYAVDDFSLPYPDPPDALRRVMAIDLWVFRDSNWSPDFPTAARQAIELYRPGYPVQVDGVVALDQHAVQALVGALGSIAVPGEKALVTGDNIIAFIHNAWAPEDGRLDRQWWAQRKSFMGPLAQAAFQRVQSGQVDWSALAQTVMGLLDEKHLLAYLDDTSAAAALAERGWDGALHQTAGDFLMVVDANLGYNKVNARVKQSLDYQVDLHATPPRVDLTLTYTHTGVSSRPCVPEVRYDVVYDQMMDRCYWDYLRLYVPQDTRLLDATRIPLPGDLIYSGEAQSGEVTVAPAAEGPWTELGVLNLLRPSAVQTRFFALALPDSVVQWQGDEGSYTLHVQKQPGTDGYPVALHVQLPEQSQLVSAAPSPVATAAGRVEFRLLLDRDRDVQIHWRKQP